MTKVYEGGIPGDGTKLFPGSSSEGQETVQPTSGPSSVGMSRVGLGSTDSSGATGKNVNPPAPGEERIATRKTVTNQPV